MSSRTALPASPVAREALRRAPLALIAPAVLAVLATFCFSDPTYRFPLLVALLPVFLRGAARALGVAKDESDASKIGRLFGILGFVGFVVGWLLAFAVLGFAVAIGLFSLPGSTDVLKTSMLLAGGGFILAAWFWWPWYARDALAAWPRTEGRIWTASGNRWDKLFLSWRMQQMAASGTLRWHGFVATSGVVVCILALAAAGAVEGIAMRLLELALVLLLPALHLIIAHEANALCARWAERPRRRPAV